jgi:uncharacterized SAM-binding protein YcdF (DUF218 family)
VARQFSRRRSSLEKERGPWHAPSLVAGALSIFLLLAIVAIRILGDQLYNYPQNPELASIPPKTAIICLAGGKFRIEAAYSLFSEGVGDRLFIIGAGKKSSPVGLAKAHASNIFEKLDEKRLEKIFVETDSANTIENAVAVSRLMEQHSEIENILLITSGYHMRRAQVMIENQLHRKVAVYPYVPTNEALTKMNWWHSWLGIQVTSMEYFKFQLARYLMPRIN